MTPPLLAYWVHDLSPFLIRFGGEVGIRWYGLAYVGAFLAGYWLLQILARRGYGELKPAQVGDFITWAALFGVLLGGRLGYLVFYDWQEFIRRPWIFFLLWEGGMASHGGVLGLVAFTFWYSRRHKLSWTGLGDNLVVVSPIGVFLGRAANFINGELYGRATTVAWAVQFPKELLDPADRPADAARIFADPALVGSGLRTFEQVVDASQSIPQVRDVLARILTPRHPSQLYEAALEGALLFAILWLVRTRVRDLRNGVLTGLFFIGYAVFRIVAEMFRDPDAALTLGMTRGQFLSVFMVAIGVAFLVTARRAVSRADG